MSLSSLLISPHLGFWGVKGLSREAAFLLQSRKGRKRNSRRGRGRGQGECLRLAQNGPRLPGCGAQGVGAVGLSVSPLEVCGPPGTNVREVHSQVKRRGAPSLHRSSSLKSGLCV